MHNIMQHCLQIALVSWWQIFAALESSHLKTAIVVDLRPNHPELTAIYILISRRIHQLGHT